MSSGMERATRSRRHRKRGPIAPAVAGWIALTVAISMLSAGPAAAREGIFVQKLSNGLTVILEENHARPLIGVSLCVRGGSRTETPEIAGLSHYYEHLIFRGGSKDQAPLEFRRHMQELGEESGGYTTDDYTNFGFTVPRENFDEAFRRATDAWLHLVPTQEKIDTERHVVLEEYNQDEGLPDYQLSYQLEKLVWQVHPYRNDTIGSRKVIEGADLSTFRTFYQERYVPNQMILSFVGDFDADSLLARIAAGWGAVPAGGACFEPGRPEPEQTAFRSAEKAMPTATTRAILAFPTPPASHADIPALETAAALLASGSSSRLWTALKVRSNQAVSVSAWVERRVDPAYFGISLEMEPAHTGEVLGTIAREIQALADHPPGADELLRAQKILLAQHERGMETVFDRATGLAISELTGSAFDLDRYPALIQGVSGDDVSRVVRTYLRPERGNLSMVRPDSAAAFDPAPWIEEWRGLARVGAAAAERQSALPTRITLSNGTILLVNPIPGAAMVGAAVLVRGGQWAEAPGQAGIANLTASLLSHGAAGLSVTDIADRSGALGASLGASGGPDFITVGLDVPKENWQSALDLMADVVTRPTFPAEEIEKVRDDILASIRTVPDRPFENTNRAYFAALYRRSPYRSPVEGNEETIRSITPDQIRDFWKTSLAGRNLVIVVVGPVDPATVESWARRRFESLPAGSPIRIGGVRDEPPLKALDLHVLRDQEQTTWNNGWLAPGAADPDYVPMRLATAILGDRFFYKYVYDEGVAYRSWFHMDRRIGQGSVQNEMGVSPGVYRRVSAEVDADILRFLKEPISAFELETAKKKVLARYDLDVQTSSALAGELAFWEMAGLGLDGYRGYPAAIRAVTPAEAAKVAHKYLLPDRRVRVAVGEVPGEGVR